MKVGDYLLCICGYSVFTEGKSYRILSIVVQGYYGDIEIKTDDEDCNWYIDKVFIDNHFILDIKKQRIEKLSNILDVKLSKINQF